MRACFSVPACLSKWLTCLYSSCIFNARVGVFIHACERVYILMSSFMSFFKSVLLKVCIRVFCLTLCALFCASVYDLFINAFSIYVLGFFSC